MARRTTLKGRWIDRGRALLALAGDTVARKIRQASMQARLRDFFFIGFFIL